MLTLTPQEFAARWANTTLGERQSYQLHFLDLCALVGHPPPDASGLDPQGLRYAFEYGVKKDAGGQGFADVFYENHFAIEYKPAGKYPNLSAAYQQLQRYRENLFNPPLLVVTDIATWEIHTNWPNTEKRVYRFSHADIAARPAVLSYLRHIFQAPDLLHPNRNTQQVTTDAARAFQLIAENMRGWQADPDRIAHFLTKLVFCLFAEDVGLLPPGPRGDLGIFSEIVRQTRAEPARFSRYTQDLFQAMADGGEVMFARIPYFNGALFADLRVEDLSLEALTELEKAARLNWQSVEPAIFGTLFERSLDPAKRSQLGAHYTSRDDILLIVEPVLMQPLRRQWEALRAEAALLRPQYDEALTGSSQRQIKTYGDQLLRLRETMLDRLRSVTVLDPACGSGNFLYVALQLLMDMEKAVIHDELFAGLPLVYPEVHPRQMYGLEKDSIAHALASIVVWIGWLQWRQTNGYQVERRPVLEDLHANIRLLDAILAPDGTEPDWPAADVIVSNPPFLGDKKMRAELGDSYVDALRRLYAGRVPGGADLVTYWFEKARAQIAADKTQRAGLLATNSIRGGANREVLKRIKDSGDIFMAWADRPWVLDGAAVRVSMVGFDDGQEANRFLDGVSITAINPDLTSKADVTKAVSLVQNHNLAFIGTQKGGSFDIPKEIAHQMISSDPKNREVVRPWLNGNSITSRDPGMWIINFRDLSLSDAEQYRLPLEYVVKNIKSSRDQSRDQSSRNYWWQFQRSRPAFYETVKGLKRYVVTPRVAKHRLFVWVSSDVVPDSAVVAIARDDDYFFGVLHSRLHEVWSLRMGTWLGKGNDPRYTPTTTFETFPFPWPPGSEDTASPAHAAISAAAAALHAERDAWLNPPGAPPAALKPRTLTNLYNALNVWRGVDSMKTVPAAADFAPRLDALHRALDAAACAAYGWDDLMAGDLLYLPAGEEEVLRRLLALNLARAGVG